MPKLCGLKQAATERIATRALGVTAPLMTLPHVSCGASRPLARICALRRSSHITTIAANASYTSLPLFAHGTTDFSRQHASARCGDLHTLPPWLQTRATLPYLCSRMVLLISLAGTHLRAAVIFTLPPWPQTQATFSYLYSRMVIIMSLYIISLARICALR